MENVKWISGRTSKQLQFSFRRLTKQTDVWKRNLSTLWGAGNLDLFRSPERKIIHLIMISIDPNIDVAKICLWNKKNILALGKIVNFLTWKIVEHPASPGPQVPNSGSELRVDLVWQKVLHLVLVGFPLHQNIRQGADHVEGAVLLSWRAFRRKKDLHQNLQDGI